MFGRHAPRVGAPFIWIIAILVVCAEPGAPQSGDPFLRVSFVDVGQGDAIWIKGPMVPTVRRAPT